MQETGTWPATRAEAWKLGSELYFSGIPCVHGHVAPHYTRNYSCQVCSRARNAVCMGTSRREHPQKHREMKRRGAEKQLVAAAGRPRPAVCEVCKQSTSKTLHWDHDHGTGAFRGWVCHGCNSALGFAKDNPATLRALADYLERGPKDVAPLAA